MDLKYYNLRSRTSDVDSFRPGKNCKNSKDSKDSKESKDSKDSKNYKRSKNGKKYQKQYSRGKSNKLGSSKREANERQLNIREPNTILLSERQLSGRESGRERGRERERERGRKERQAVVSNHGYTIDDFTINDNHRKTSPNLHYELCVGPLYEDDSDEEYIYSDALVEPEYFKTDSEPLQREIINALSKKLELNPNKIRPIISNIFSEYGDAVMSEYLGCKPADERWTLSLDKRQVEDLRPLLKNIREAIEADTPTMEKILRANLPFSDKKYCVELFDILENMEPYTKEYFELRNQINSQLKNCCLDKEEIQCLDNIEARLKKQATNTSLRSKILRLNAPEELKMELYKKYQEMKNLNPDNSNYASLKENLEWWVSLPHQNSSIKPDNISKYCLSVRKILDTRLYGMDALKLKLLEILNNNITSNGRCGGQLTLKSSPGMGKTSIGSALAKALGRHFEKISAGGLNDAVIFKGSNKVWSSSGPSILLEILRRAQSNDPIIMIDEIDKASEKVQNALLDVADLESRKQFRDNFLTEYHHNLENIWIIYCINDDTHLVKAFHDRMDFFELAEYTEVDKDHIVSNFILPKTLKSVGMASNDVIIPLTLARYFRNLVGSTTPGMRQYEKAMYTLVSRLNMLKTHKHDTVFIQELNLPYLLKDLSFPCTLNDYQLKTLLI